MVRNIYETGNKIIFEGILRKPALCVIECKVSIRFVSALKGWERERVMSGEWETERRRERESVEAVSRPVRAQI